MQVIDSYVARVREIGLKSVVDAWSKSSEVLNVAILNAVQMVMTAKNNHKRREFLTQDP